MPASQQTFARKKPDQLVYLELGSGNGGMLLSLSEDGFRFRAVTPLRSNGLVPFAFSLDGANRLQGIGEIEWLEDNGKSGGIRFNELSPESRAALDKWLAVDSHHRTSGREVMPAAATPLETMEKIREELRRGYPARPVSEQPLSPRKESRSARPSPHIRAVAEQHIPLEKIPEPAKPAVTEQPTPEKPVLAQPPNPIFRESPAEDTDGSLPSSPPPTILERLMGVRSQSSLSPASPSPETFLRQDQPALEQPASTRQVPPPHPPFKKLPDPPVPPGMPPFSSSAFLKPSRERPTRESHPHQPDPAHSAAPPLSPPHDDSLPSLRSFSLTDSGDVKSSSSAPPSPAPAAISPRAHTPPPERSRITYMPVSEAAPVRPYIPPPDESLDAAWERAKLSAPADSPHLSRAAAVSIIGLALVVIIAALVYNFRQDIGALIIDVGQKVSGRSERPITSPEPAPQTGAGGQAASVTDSTVAGSAAAASAQPGIVDSNSPAEAQPAPQPSTASERPAVSPPETNNKPASNKSAATPAKSSKPSSVASVAKDKRMASVSGAVSSTTRPVEQPPDTNAPPSEPGSGLEEFNIARNILQGSNRRSELQTAIALLWSSVRKGNVPAEVTLADLYRRGEGVERNCDQAQVLLVAASRKGSPDARRMLEIMAEQGCQ